MRAIRIIFCVLCIVATTKALDVTINYGKQNNEYFSVLNLQHSEPFECQEFTNEHSEPIRVVCIIERTPRASFSPTNTIFFRFYNRVIDGHFYLYIEPNFSSKLFNTFSDLKTNDPIPKERPKKSKNWQMVGFKGVIPFLSQTKSKGLNFPVAVLPKEEQFVGELDINRAPLHFDEGQDFAYYLKAQNLIKSQSYLDAIKIIDDTLRVFPDTIFVRDLLFYRIVALREIDEVENADSIVNTGVQWVKRYPTDMNIPEVLYTLGNAYVGIHFISEAKYYYDRLITEYPNSRFAPLAKMQLARSYYGLEQPQQAMRHFIQAYEEAKDLDSASLIAIKWSEFYMSRQENKEAKRLVDTLMAANPTYFVNNLPQSLDFITTLTEHEMWESAAKISEYLYNNTDDDDLRVLRDDLLNKTAIFYQNFGDYENAHRINLLYAEEYPHKGHLAEVKERDDELLFDIGLDDSPDEKITRYDYLMQKYPNTPVAQKALNLKAQILFDRGEYENVIAQNGVEAELIDKSYYQILLRALQEKDCKAIAKDFSHYKKEQFTFHQNFTAFECLYSLALNAQAQVAIENLAKEAQDPQTKLSVLYMETQNLDKLGKNKPTLLSARDTLNLAKGLKQREYYDVGFIFFRHLILSNNLDEATQVYTFLHEQLSDDIRLIDVELELLKRAESEKNEVSIEVYARDILRLQKLHKNTHGTPYVDFALAQSLMRLGRYNQSLEVLDTLAKKDIEVPTLAQALYLKGSVQKTQNNEKDARLSFNQCKELQSTQAQQLSVWKNLCTQALEILQ